MLFSCLMPISATPRISYAKQDGRLVDRYWHAAGDRRAFGRGLSAHVAGKRTGVDVNRLPTLALTHF